MALRLGVPDDYASQQSQSVDAQNCNLVFTDTARLGEENNTFEFGSLYCFPAELGTEVKSAEISKRYSSACALKNDNRLACWTDGLPQAFKPGIKTSSSHYLPEMGRSEAGVPSVKVLTTMRSKYYYWALTADGSYHVWDLEGEIGPAWLR